MKKSTFAIWVIILIVLGVVATGGCESSSSYSSNDYLSESNYTSSDTENDTDTVITETVTESTNNSSTNTNTLTLEQENALATAFDYLNYTAFSRSGLIEQLEFEGYSNESATFAVDSCGANWNEQAAIMAQQYIDYTSFSRTGLIEQLMFEGFTSEQAEYGVSAVGY